MPGVNGGLRVARWLGMPVPVPMPMPNAAVAADRSAPQALPSRALRSGLTRVWPLVAPLLLVGCVVHPPARQAPPPVVHRPAPVPAAAPMAVPMFFYPERGQPEALQDRDRYECYRWAVGQSGFDPGMTPVRQVPPPPLPAPAPRPARPQGPDVATGAAVGAAVGAVVAPPRHAAEGAVLGAIFGAVLGSAAHAQRQADGRVMRANPVPAPAALPPGQDPFRRAMSACMQGRGYRVG